MTVNAERNATRGGVGMDAAIRPRPGPRLRRPPCPNQASWSARVTTDPTMMRGRALDAHRQRGQLIEGTANDPLAWLGASLDQRRRVLPALPWVSNCSRMVAQEEEPI